MSNLPPSGEQSGALGENALGVLLSEVKGKPRFYFDDFPTQWTLVFHHSVSAIGTPKGEFNSSSSEEARAYALEILNTIFTPTVGTIFSNPKRRALLGHFVAILLAVGKEEKNRKNAELSLQVLQKVCSTVKSADTLSCFLPGISTGVCKIVCGDFKRGHALPCLALDVWGTLLFGAIGDDVSKDLLRNFRGGADSRTAHGGAPQSAILQMKGVLEGHGVLSGAGKEKDATTRSSITGTVGQGTISGGASKNHMDIRVSRDQNWLYETTARISMLIKNAIGSIKQIGLNSQNRWKVRLAGIQFAEKILLGCSRTMTASCMDDLIEMLILFTLDQANDDIVAASERLLETSKARFVEQVWSRLDVRFRNLLVSLSRTARGGDDQHLHSALLTATGYARLLQTRLGNVFSIDETPKLCRFIAQALALDRSAITEQHRGPLVYRTYFNRDQAGGPRSTQLTAAYYDVPFKYVRSKACRTSVGLLLESVGRYTDSVDVLSYLTDETAQDWRISRRCECVFMTNAIFAGALADLTEDFVCTFLQDTVRCHEWNNASGTANAASAPYNDSEALRVKGPVRSFEERFESEVAVSLLLSRLAHASEVRQGAFKSCLMDLVYPLLEKLGDPGLIVVQAALASLLRISNACEYTGIDALIEDNVDYLIDNICLRLTFLEDYPFTPRVIRGIVVHAANYDTTGALLHEVVNTLLRSIDSEISNTNGGFYASSKHLVTLMMAVHDLMAALEEHVQKVLVAEGVPLRGKRTFARKRPRSSMEVLIDEIVEWDRHLTSIDAQDDVDIRAPPTLKEESAADDAEEIVGEEDPSAAAPCLHEREAAKTLLTKVRHFLPGGPVIMRCKVLETMRSGFKVLALVENDLLPAVAQSWDTIAAMCRAPELPVFCSALGCMSTLCELCSQFIQARFTKKLWPILKREMLSSLSQLWSAKTSVSLEDLRAVNQNADADGSTRSRKELLASRSPVRKRLLSILSFFEKTCSFCPGMLAPHAWELARACCRALRAIPEEFLNGKDHSLILSLLQKLKTAEETAVFHAIVLSEGLCVRPPDGIVNLPRLQFVSQSSHPPPIYGEGLLLQKTGFCIKSMVNKMKHGQRVDRWDLPFRTVAGWERIFANASKETPTLGVNFVKANKKVFEVEMKDKSVLPVRQRLDLGLGAVVWDCGLVLSALLQDLPSSFLTRRSVIDLGCGTGFCGIVASAKCSAAHVVLTDVTEIMPLVNENVQGAIACNFISASNSIVAEHFDWCALLEDGADDSKNSWVPQHGFDVVLASDCLYEPKHYEGLLLAFDKVLASSGILIIVYRMRHADRERLFFQKMKDRGFAFTCLHQEALQPKRLRNTGLYVFFATKDSE